MTHNPFAPAGKVAKKLKVLLFGPAGSGKTTAALTFPKAAVIDTEGGTDLYAGRGDTPPFDVLRAKTLSDLEAAIKFIATGQHDYETLVIDSVTVLYEVAREALAKGSKSGEMSYREWGKLNTRMDSVYNLLSDLPVHVVMVAREATEYEGSGDSLRKVGTKPDTDKSIVYNADFVIRMDERRQGRVIKSRGRDIAKEGELIRRISWDIFAPLAEAFSDGSAASHVNKNDAIDAEVEPLTDRENASAFVACWRGQGLKDSEILAALGVERVSQWLKGRKAADDAVQAWLEKQFGKQAPSPASEEGETDTESPDDGPDIASYATLDAVTAGGEREHV